MSVASIDVSDRFPEAASSQPDVNPAAEPPVSSDLSDAPPEVIDQAASDAPAEHESEPAPRSAGRDWSHVLGFQAVGSAQDESGDYAEELRKELSARSTRFANAVDESIVLSSEGAIRWLGDPIARVVSGESLLQPRAVLLADAALEGEDLARVENRLQLWLSAHVKKILGPLSALQESADAPDPAKALGKTIADALGVLERERVRNDVRNLDQNARAALRKLGVRFGSLYLYVPALLKPAARSLCSLLWTLQRGGETVTEGLLAFAAAGRTSFANEGLLPPDAYRVAGFRLCGERVVRVDIIERLADLIRAALPDRSRLAEVAGGDGYGFIITPQMTSLTGCSGEAFASILRSLGYEPATVHKAAYERLRRTAAMDPVKPTSSAANEASEEKGASPEDEGTAVGGDENASAINEPPSGDALSDAAPALGPSLEEASVSPEPEPEGISADEIAHSDATAPEPSQAAEPDEAALQAAEDDLVAPPDTADQGSETRLEPSAAEPIALDPAAPQAAETEAAVPDAAPLEPEAQTAAGAPLETGEVANPETAGPKELIEVWRPIPRRPRVSPREREAHSGGGRSHRRPHRDRSQPKAATAEVGATTDAAAAPEAQHGNAAQHRAPDKRPPHGEGQRRWEGRPKREERSGDNRRFGKEPPPKREPRPAQVDPDSPFAKLAALKPLLERRDKRP